jgi:glycerophosphoryl diester phosphodiesterase
VDTLLKYGYRGQYMSENWLKQPLFIQSFAPTSLVHVSKLIDSPKIFLIDDFTIRTQDTNQVQILFTVRSISKDINIMHGI